MTTLPGGKRAAGLGNLRDQWDYWDYLPSVFLCSRWKRSPARPCSEKKTNVRPSQTCTLSRTQQKSGTTENTHTCMHTYFHSFTVSSLQNHSSIQSPELLQQTGLRHNWYFIIWTGYNNWSSSWLNDNWLLERQSEMTEWDEKSRNAPVEKSNKKIWIEIWIADVPLRCLHK